MDISFESREYEQLVIEGINAAKAGNHAQARRLLEKATTYHRQDARPWIWLSSTTEDRDERLRFLECAVAADPSNAAARKALAILTERLDITRLVKEGEVVEPRRPIAPEEAHAQAFMCPQCGAQLHFDPGQKSLACDHCSYSQKMQVNIGADSAEQVMDFVLPTTRSQRWAEAQHCLSCEQCGAITLLPAGQMTVQCPYCGSNQLVEAAEKIELIDPHAIGLMQVDSNQALKNVQEWLGKGMSIPDDLAQAVRKVILRPAYYPFWTFDGIAEISWRCEVNRGTSRNPNWVPSSGVEGEIYDDVLVPGLKLLDSKQLEKIKPFSLKAVAEFDPQYLAGWLALGYDLPMAEASLLAREKVLAKVRRELYSRVEPGREKRNLNTGGAKWSAQTFKHVLLPLYTGAFEYKGKKFPLWVNGQTGEVTGLKPRDRLKMILISVSAAFTLMVVVVLLFLLLGGGLPAR